MSAPTASAIEAEARQVNGDLNLLKPAALPYLLPCSLLRTLTGQTSEPSFANRATFWTQKHSVLSVFARTRSSAARP